MATKIGNLIVSTVLSDLVGALVERDQNRYWDANVGDQAWPTDEANANGERIGTIRAVWISKDDALRILVEMPSGLTFTTFLTAGICHLYRRR